MSAGVHPVKRITRPAAMTATEPSMSATTCRKAPRTLRFSDLWRDSTQAESAFAASPTTATMSITVVSISWVSPRRPTARTRIHPTTPVTVTALMRAASTSTRRWPKVALLDAAFFPTTAASSAMIRPAASESMCIASESSASEPEIRPAASSAKNTVAVMANATASARSGADVACVPPTPGRCSCAWVPMAPA